jgi:SAM-dependent methyltransferase
METAKIAGVDLDYVIGNVLDIDMWVYGGFFDMVFMEGGILHYFHDIKRFMNVMYGLLKDGGRMICSDFHPIHKITDVLDLRGRKNEPAELSEADYFSTVIEESEMPHARYYDEEKRGAYPKCSLRRYTLSDIINAAVGAGFIIRGFDEHPAWTNPKLPGEFTLLAEKCECLLSYAQS